MENLISVAGMLVLLLIALVASTNRRAIRLRVIVSALGLQFFIGFFVFYLPWGRAMLESLSLGVVALLNYANAGISMVFGPLVSEQIGISFALNVLPVIIFFSALTSVLYHMGVMQRLVAGVGWVLDRLLACGRLVSMNAAANIFVGQTEAPLVIRPYLSGITEPQLFAIMVSGLASIAGSLLLAYAGLGIDMKYLLAASFMAAPGGLLMAKIMMPDDPGSDEPQDLIASADKSEPHTNVFMAAGNGAKDGMHLALNIGAMLIAFVSLIALLNGIIGIIGGVFGVEGLTIQYILGAMFAPLMFLLSVPWAEAQAAGGIVGEKIIVNEFVAFLSLQDAWTTFSPRSQAVVTVALCGFANLSSVGILLGGLGTLVPDRMPLIAKFGLRAVLAGTLSNLMSAAIAGLLFVA